MILIPGYVRVYKCQSAFYVRMQILDAICYMKHAKNTKIGIRILHYSVKSKKKIVSDEGKRNVE